MKKLNYLASFLIAAVLLSSCGGIDKMKEEYGTLTFSTTPKVLEMHGGEVEYTIKGDIPPEWFNKKAIVEFTPVLTYDGGEKVLESKTFQGIDVQDNHKVIEYETGGTINFEGTFEYEEGMRASQLVMRGEARVADGDDVLPLPEKQIAKGVIATPNLVMVDPKPVMIPDNFKRITMEEQQADIHYLIERDNVRKSELTQDDIKKLEEFVKNVEKAQNKTYKGIKIHGYASPDGPIDLNERLSKGRKNSANSYFDKVVDKKKLSEDEAKKVYEEKATTEDWEGFKNLVQQSNIEDKDLILRVLSMYSDPDVREKEIKNMAATFEVLADEILPKLRRSEFMVQVEKVGFSDQEIREFVDTKPDTLNLEELLYAGYELFEDADQKLKAFELAAEVEPNCLRAYNNIAAVKLMKGEMDDAQDALEKANELKEGNPYVLNNMGVIALHEGNVEEAKEYFQDATEAGNEVEYNLGIVSIKEGKYDAAINYTQNYESFNTALAMLLGGKQGNALTMLEQIDDKSAKNHYLQAVIAARSNNQEEVINNLRSAIEMDADLKEMAATDMEFVEFLQNQAFQSIVQ
jgi:tetratricopeptide (TPR) repeat protein